MNTPAMTKEQLKALQAPIKQRYRELPQEAIVVSRSSGDVLQSDLSCMVSTFAGKVRASLHPAAGGDGQGSCSADMLLDSLVACAGVTLAAVATAMDIVIEGSTITAEGVMDFRGTLGVDRETPIGVTHIKLHFELRSAAPAEQLAKLIELTERYCVIYQTFENPPHVESSWEKKE